MVRTRQYRWIYEDMQVADMMTLEEAHSACGKGSGRHDLFTTCRKFLSQIMS